MLNIVANNADFIMAAAQAALAADMVPTVWHQFRSKTCSIPLISSIITTTMLVTVSVTLFSVGLPVSSVFAGLCAAVWALTAVQRVRYGRRNK